MWARSFAIRKLIWQSFNKKPECVESYTSCWHLTLEEEKWGESCKFLSEFCTICAEPASLVNPQSTWRRHWLHFARCSSALFMWRAWIIFCKVATGCIFCEEHNLKQFLPRSLLTRYEGASLRFLHRVQKIFWSLVSGEMSMHRHWQCLRSLSNSSTVIWDQHWVIDEIIQCILRQSFILDHTAALDLV